MSTLTSFSWVYRLKIQKRFEITRIQMHCICIWMFCYEYPLLTICTLVIVVICRTCPTLIYFCIYVCLLWFFLSLFYLFHKFYSFWTKITRQTNIMVKIHDNFSRFLNATQSILTILHIFKGKLIVFWLKFYGIQGKPDWLGFFHWAY